MKNTLLKPKILLVLLMGVASSLQIGCFDDSPEECARKYSEIQQEFDKIEPPKDATPYSTRSGPSCNYGYATVGQLFSSDLSYEQIRDYYDNALRREGWVFDNKYGEDQLAYSKRNLRACVKSCGIKV